ncbi:hypothetical protein [Limosilactobacillus agrestimuris]|uniref:hypothetical protein n=1 Tax=Limosilactobacillus agrestimuris TaxID=2941331 RepID=UPI00203C4130|nr:hypothetical protein [Limosilactobacillus agrestimuris]
MILLASNYTSSPVFSGLIAAVISGIVAIIGYVITSVVQSKNGEEAIKMQKEIAEMQKNQKLFYESQLQWANETRRLIAKFISGNFRFNIIVKNIGSIRSELSKSDLDNSKLGELSEKINDNVQKLNELLSELTEEATMIRLYLFHEDNIYEKRILDVVSELAKNTNEKDGVDIELLQKLIETTRKYFNQQMEELKNKSA